MRVASLALIALTALSGCGEIAGTAALTETTASIAKPGKPEKACTAVSAIATGFGENTVTGFARSNLTLAIDKAKDEMAAQGAKGFTVEARTVTCEGYIDFGGVVGREHKCHATAQLCRKA